ncbi:MAG TPA: hypothetical protein H9962_06960 [Candidatus Mailhella merdigallinarum]|uniref:DUF2730 family protein n=1 Tax=Candidatus Mailhella merdigallinarum TaxID=2838658 RepID=A0A9D2KMH8_9BACT|nr:hypothetical protein [Candidatus Mailhella merdigallinarum]
MLDLALRYSPLISLAAPIVTLTLVAWLSRYFVPLRRYERERAGLDDRLEVISETLDKHGAELRKKPDAATVADLTATIHRLSCDVAVLGESLRDLRSDVNRVGHEVAEVRQIIMARQV